MSVFAAAVDAMFADATMARDALYRAGGTGAGVTVRVIRRAPDEIGRFGEARFVAETMFLDLRVSEAPGLAVGDTLEIDGEVLEVRSEPVRDRERLVWTVEGRVL